MKEDVIQQPPCIPWDPSSGYRDQRLSHDFVKELPRERSVCFCCRPIWTLTTLVMLTSLCIGDARPCASPTRSHGGYGEIAGERAGERKKEEEEKRKKDGRSPFIPTRTFLKWAPALHLLIVTCHLIHIVPIEIPSFSPFSFLPSTETLGTTFWGSLQTTFHTYLRKDT
jgi:hypothetical protein